MGEDGKGNDKMEDDDVILFVFFITAFGLEGNDEKDRSCGNDCP